MSHGWRQEVHLAQWEAHITLEARMLLSLLTPASVIIFVSRDACHLLTNPESQSVLLLQSVLPMLY